MIISKTGSDRFEEKILNKNSDFEFNFYLHLHCLRLHREKSLGAATN
jgi:hypothetical protein